MLLMRGFLYTKITGIKNQYKAMNFWCQMWDVRLNMLKGATVSLESYYRGVMQATLLDTGFFIFLFFYLFFFIFFYFFYFFSFSILYLFISSHSVQSITRRNMMQNKHMAGITLQYISNVNCIAAL